MPTHVDRAKRQTGVDNLRGLLIFLVVFGHLIETATEGNGFARVVFTLIYLVHMPLFAGVSGYLSRRQLEIGKVLRGIVVPYLLAELAYRLFANILLEQPAPLTQPYWLLWFLFSLTCWRLALPMWMKLPNPLCLATLVSLVAGCFDGIDYSYSLSRTIYFFPFFVLGHQLRDCRVTEMDYRLGAAAVLILAIFAVAMLPASYSFQQAFGSLGYSEFGQQALPGMLTRLTHYAAALSLGFAVLCLVPSGQTVLALMGSHTLRIYVGHGFVVLALREMGYGETPYILILSLAVAFTLCVALIPWIRVRDEWSVWTRTRYKSAKNPPSDNTSRT